MGKPHGWMDEPHVDAFRRHPRGHQTESPGPRLGTALHPLISWGEAAKGPKANKVNGEKARSEALMPCPVPCSDDTFVLRVTGESMEPKFHDGELIYVDPQVSPTGGRYVVVRLRDTKEAVLRQIVVEGGHEYFVCNKTGHKIDYLVKLKTIIFLSIFLQVLEYSRFF